MLTFKVKQDANTLKNGVREIRTLLSNLVILVTFELKQISSSDQKPKNVSAECATLAKNCLAHFCNHYVRSAG